jgi:integrase
MPVDKLTDAECRSAKASAKSQKLFDGYGLYLLVKPTGSKLWQQKYRFMGKEKTFAIGAYPLVGLAAAREKSRQVRLLLKDGVDPVANRRMSKKQYLHSTATFKQLTLRWFEKRKGSLSSGHLKSVQGILQRDLLKELGGLPAESITPRMALRALEQIEARGAVEMAYRSRLYASQVYDWAKAAQEVTHNPFDGLQKALKARRVQNMRVIPQEEFPLFWTKLENDKEMFALTKIAMQLTVLSMTRTNEIRFAKWAELKDDMWVIPAERMKMGKAHVVPLTTDIKRMFEAARQSQLSEIWVFPQIRNFDKPMSENTMLYALYRLGWHSRATIHGFRSLASTVLHEQSEFRSEAIEAQLAHSDRNTVRAIYNKAEYMPERRRLLEWWADWCYGRLTKESAAGA